MSAYTVSQLAHNAGVSVHIVRDYLVRGLLRPVACTTGGYGVFDDAALQRLCFVRAAFEAGIGLDALARLCRALDAADGAQAAAQLDLHYQPLVDLRDHRIAGAEALMRWRHPRLGLLPPGQFLPLAESFGLMPEIGAWVLGEACRQMHKWQGPAWQPFRLAINVSASQVGPTFDDEVKRVLADMALPAELLEIELTESVAFGNPALFDSFDALRAIGVRFAADDFGTGYSCLQHLKCCPITTLKIDQSFVARLPDDARDQTIVRAVIQLAHGLGMDVIFRRRLHQLIGRNGCCAASS